jgi:hypothetical protein
MKSGSVRNGFGVPLWFLALLLASLCASAASIDKILQDVPGRLVLELNVPSYSVAPVGATPGMQVSCQGCHPSGRPGAPDLPVYRFQVLSGPAAPKAVLRILESETRSIPEGIAPFPRNPTPSTYEYRPDADLFRQASALESRNSELRRLRAAPVRLVEVPLALWSENGRTLTLIKKLRIELDFPGVLARPAARQLEGSFRREVKNPVGGAYLYASAGRASLAKASAQPRIAARDSLGNRFIKIKIGDKALENFLEDRVYAVSYGEFSKLLPGGDLNGVKIENLRMFAGINDTLPRDLDSTDPVSGTLREIPIQVVDKNENGTFDSEDSVRFFAHGTSIWKRLPAATGRIRFEFSADPYSFENDYYLDFAPKLSPALRLAVSPAGAPAGSPLTDSYSYLRAEKEVETAACDPSIKKDKESGFEWHWFWKGGDDCNGSSNFDVTLTRGNLQSAETATLPDLVRNGSGDSLFMGFYTWASRSDSIFTAYYGGKGDTLAMMRGTGSPGTWFVWDGPIQEPSAFQLDSLQWRGSERRFEGYTVCYRRKHVYNGNPLWIFPPETGKAVSYQVQNGPGLSCLRVEDGVATKLMALDGSGVFTDSLASGSDARYFVFRNASQLPPNAMEADGLPASGTALRNLATGDETYPEYLIVTARPLLDQALALRDYRNAKGRAIKVKTEVVLVEDIYRQYSGGRLSVPAIRDFIRHAFNGWGNPLRFGVLKYVLFFGDGHYDYRNIKTAVKRDNLVPPNEFLVYPGEEEVASDDFYAMLGSGGGGSGSNLLDVSMGRLPVQTPEEAKNYLDKIADYENPALAGEWRSRVVLAADDNLQYGSPGNIDPITSGHTTDTDRIGALIAANQKGTTLDKVYLLDYPMNAANHKPEAAQDLLGLINRGALLVNYVGHGAANQWADEILLQTNDAISRMRNKGRTPMINAFSCTVGRFESLTSEGMSEAFVKQKGIGAIGAISATRESYPTPNIALANAFYELAFPPDTSGIVETVGDALRRAKNGGSVYGGSLNDMKYHLLGEPVLLLRKPQLSIMPTRVMDTIQALDCGTITGRVAGGSGKGRVNVKVVAGAVHKVYELGPSSKEQEVDKRGNILFERTFPYVDGKFSTEYFIPNQISFGDTNAQVQFFAWDDSLEMEGTAAVMNLHIKGTANSACASDPDGKGPRIRITGCESKETANLDFPSRVKLSLPYCLQLLVQDSLGGVQSGDGPDEGTTIEIPGTMDPFHPQPGIDDLYLKSYQFSLDKKSFKPGTHLLKVSARDGFGNISQRQMQMDLTADSSLTAVTAYNIPNPMKRSGTTFHFATVLPTADLEFGDPNAGKDRLEFEIKIYNQNGSLVRRFQNAVSGQTSWDGRDNWGNLLANGAYFYQVTARQLLVDQSVNPDYRTVNSKRNILVISR